MTSSAVDTKISVVLVEAFVGKEAEDISATPTKRLKLDPAVPDTNILLVTAGDGTGDVIKYFNFAMKCWNFLTSTEAHQKGILSNLYILSFSNAAEDM